MPTNSKSKKPSSTVNESTQPEVQPDPEGFLAELKEWGHKPNPASFEKLLETYQEMFARALEQGYSAEDICRLAADYGIQIKPSTFRKYWQKLKAKSSNESTVAAPSKSSTPKQVVNPDSPASTTANSAVNF